MFSIIYCFLPIIFIPFNMYLMKSRESVSWDVRKGKKCYNCKDNLDLSNEDLLKRLLDDKNHKRLCISCSRDMKLSLIKNPISSLKFKFHKYIFSKESDKMVYYFTVFVFFFILLDIILMIFGIKSKIYLIYGTINIFFWIVNTYKTIYTTTKKTSE
jgi:hypothetical protein